MSSYVQYTGNGSTTTFSVTFPYLSQTHVVVSVDGNVKLSPADFEWLTAASIGFRVAPSGTITIRRITERTVALVDFQNGSVLTEEELNTAILQNFYITQELQDALDGYINGGVAFYTSGSLVGSTVQDRIDAAAAEILDSALLADLNARIGDIDTNAESIIATNATIVDIQDQITALDSTNGGTAALIVAEEATRIAGDEAIAETIALIGAKSGDNLAFILDLNTTRVGATESLATRLSTLAATDGANSAAISSETSARAAADSAIAGSVTTLQSVVNGNTASISTQQGVINGVIAQYMVKLDVNGHVSGFGLYNSAGSSSFIVNASKFAVTDGTSSKIPFLVSGGVCYMQNVVIQDALIANLTVGKLTSGTLGATITGGASSIIKFGQTAYDTGTGYFLGYSGGAYKLSIGVGSGGKALLWDGTSLTLRGADLTLDGGAGYVRYLGTNIASTYIDWYGSSTVNDANAKFFIKKDGTAQFAGRIRGEFEPKAWGAIYGEGTPYFKDRFNCGSVSKLGTGRYRVYFASALPNANYACVASGSDPSKIVIITVSAQATTYVDLDANKRGDGNFIDISILNFIIFGSNVPGGDNVSTPSGSYGGGTRGEGNVP